MTHPGRLSVDATLTELKSNIAEALPGCEVEARGSGGHFEITVVSGLFEGLNTLKKQRLVYSAIKELMAGHDAPIHAVDRLVTRTPADNG